MTRSVDCWAAASSMIKAACIPEKGSEQSGFGSGSAKDG